MLTAQERTQLPAKVELKIHLVTPYGNTYPPSLRQFLRMWKAIIMQ